MNTFASTAEMQALEKLRDEELEEARALQSERRLRNPCVLAE